MTEFHGRVVLVMGAGGAIGRAVALAFARQGAQVAVNDLSPLNLEETVRQVQAVQGQCLEYGFDIAKKMPLQALVNQVLDDFNRIDILVNACVVQPVVPLLEMDEWDWHRALDVNLAGPFFATQVVGRVMRVQGGGAIINLILPPDGLAQHSGRAALAASQAGLLGLTRSAAAELTACSIRVNAVLIELLPRLQPSDGNPPAPLSSRPGRVEYLPLEDPTGLEAIAEQVVFLSSQAAQHLTGQVISARVLGSAQ